MAFALMVLFPRDLVTDLRLIYLMMELVIYEPSSDGWGHIKVISIAWL